MLTLMLNHSWASTVLTKISHAFFVSSIHSPLQFPLWILISFVSVYANEDMWTNKSCTTLGIQLRRFSFARICQYHFYRTSKALPKNYASYLRWSLIQNPINSGYNWFPSWNSPPAICSVTQLSILRLGRLNDLQAIRVVEGGHTICSVYKSDFNKPRQNMIITKEISIKHITKCI